ncbi:MAG: hypothetical protein EAZ62_08870 [Sphingobacteriia bacterium]|nr:MAG: hypothetical protein EAZ62_08870 [Sphingobacteriia bacterium]
MRMILLMFGFFVWGTATVQAQGQFLYLQSENNQPYYLLINNQVFASNGKGYLMIPQMRNGEYKVVLGFPANAYAEKQFPVTIDNRPKGYHLRYTKEGEWVFQDMVSLELVRGGEPGRSLYSSPEPQIRKLAEKKTEAGTEIIFSVRNGTGPAESVVIMVPKATTPPAKQQ